MNGRRLYEEIGGVDERYLQQAAGYRVRKKTPAWRVVLIAAALMLTASLLLGTLAMSFGIGLLGLLFDSLGQPNDHPQPPVLSAMAEMERTMTEEQQSIHPSTAQDLELFDDRPTLIWSDGDSGQYYSVVLSNHELEQMLYLMQKVRPEYTHESEQPEVQIWISFGDGLVISPYLKNTAGNVGHGEVFDYDPELELSDELAEYIADCVLS